MKLTVIEWLREGAKAPIGKSIELLFRLTIALLPLGFYLLLIQLRDKSSKVSGLSAYTSERSEWQFVFPGFMLVSENPKALKEAIIAKNNALQGFVMQNKYSLAFFFMLTIVILMMVFGG